MDKITKSFEDIFEYNNTASRFVNRDKRNENTHLAVAINKLAPALTKAIKPYNKLATKWNKKIDDLKCEYAHTDSDGVLQFEMVDAGGGQKVKEFKYKKDKWKELQTKLGELNEKREDEIEAFLEREQVSFRPCFAVALPSGLTEWEKQIFRGIVIDPKMLDKQTETQTGNSTNGEANTSEKEALVDSPQG